MAEQRWARNGVVVDEPVASIHVVVGCAPGERRERLRKALVDAGMDVVRLAATARDMVAATRALRPQVVLVGSGVRGNAIAAVADVAELDPAICIVVLGDSDDEAEFLAALSAGASGFLPVDLAPETVARSVAAVVRGEGALPRRLEQRLIEAYRSGVHHHVELPGLDGADLTEREWQVLQLVWQGRTTREIADRLFVAPATVRTHIAAVLHKLGLTSRDDVRRLVDGD